MLYHNLYDVIVDGRRKFFEQAYASVTLRCAYLEQCGLSQWECRDGGTIFDTAGESHANRFYEAGARLLILEIKPQFSAQLRDQGLPTDNTGNTGWTKQRLTESSQHREQSPENPSSWRDRDR
jgi:hypothetical protein